MNRSVNLTRPLPSALSHLALLSTLAFLLAACGAPKQSITSAQAKVDYDLLFSMPEQIISYEDKVAPILERRCVVCHGCYDAPCQLKLTSPAGIQRGASKEQVYDGARIKAAEPSRLFIDGSPPGSGVRRVFIPW